jgi:GcrA cell cycle regulator
MTQSTWSDDRIAELKHLWQEGLSASQVADTLGSVSRNAVIGKIHRLGLAGRGAGSSIPRRPRSPRAPRPERLNRPPSAVAVIEMDPLPLADGSFATMRSIDTQMCRWPIGDPTTATFHFCGRPHKEGSPYCEAHALRAHQPQKARGAAAPNWNEPPERPAPRVREQAAACDGPKVERKALGRPSRRPHDDSHP